MEDTPEIPHTPPPPGSVGAQTTNADEIAARIASESAAAVPRPASLDSATANTPGPQGGGGGPVDRWGRAFDPELHVTNKHGEPALRGGTLITRAGKQGSGPGAATRQAATGPGVNVADQKRLALEAARGAGAADEDQDDAPQPEQPAAPAFTPEEFRRRAESAAKFVRKAFGRFGRWMAGEEGEYQTIDGSHEGQEIQDATLDVQMEYQKLLPVGSVAMLIMAVGSYSARCWGSEKNQERVDELWAKFQGRPVPRKPTEKPQPGQPPQPKPAADYEPPAKPVTVRVIPHL